MTNFVKGQKQMTKVFGPLLFQGSDVFLGGAEGCLEDHAMTCKWLVSLVILVRPRPGDVGPLYGLLTTY